MPLIIKRAADVISSRNNPLVIRIGKLEDKKHRENERLFRFDGVKLLCEAIEFGAEIEYILVREDAYNRIIGYLDDHFSERDVHCSGALVILSGSAFEKLSSEKSPEGVITVAKYIDKFHKIGKIEKDGIFSGDEKVLALEAIRDPGNMGTILRSAAAFGIKRVVLSTDCADVYNMKTLRAAMGAIFKVETVRVPDIKEAVLTLRGLGRRAFAAALDKDALKLGAFDLKKTDVFLIGNEGHGLSAGAICAADKSVFIPMAEGTESLNAAIAASVCLWEISKI